MVKKFVRNQRMSKMGENLLLYVYLKKFTYKNILFLILERFID